MFSSVQFSRSVVSDSLQPHESQHARPPCPSPTHVQTHVHRVSDAIQPSLSLSSPFLLPPILPRIRVFSNVSSLHRATQDLLAVQGTLKSLLQNHSSKASILRCSAFFTVQLSHPYMTTGKTIPLTRRTFGGKVISLLFNRLSRLFITFLPRSKHLLIHGCSHHLQ